ncbi:hypothetical protein KEM56_002425 [Ascosphaera pollenicola]|nr:hypothetical protein KEM56_002425 [Ascosphaera pollenicola]
MATPETTQVPLINVGDVKNYIINWPSNAGSALKGTFATLSIRDYIRLVWIVGGYIILRPYLEKLFKFMFDRGQKKNEEGEEEEEEDLATGKTKLSANDLRGVSSGVDYPGQEDEEESENENVKPPVPQWGRAARLRQKKAIQLIEEEYARRQAEEDDKDIEDLLED